MRQRKRQRRPVYYEVSCMRDGTVLGARPIRKPSSHFIKTYRLLIDEDNVCQEFVDSGEWFWDQSDDYRFRFHDIVSNALNMRRAVRAVLLPRLESLEAEVVAVRAQLDRIEQAILNQPVPAR
jgi:hypothetical protein